MDNLDWNDLQHPPLRGTINDNTLNEPTPQFEEASSLPQNVSHLIKQETIKIEKHTQNQGRIPHEKLDNQPTLAPGHQEDIMIIRDDPDQE